MRIKPAAGLSVRDPVTKKIIPEEGFEVPEFDMYWTARLRDGDVVPVVAEPGKTKTVAETK